MKLKEQLKTHLTNKKEVERLKRIEVNSKLKKFVLLSNDTPQCNALKNHLDQEGIKYTLKTLKKHKNVIDEATSITNLYNFPMIHLNDSYLVSQRDFQNPQQAVQALQHLASPDYKIKKSDIKTLEHMKTMQYHIWTKLNNLEQKLTPTINFITNLQKELKEEGE